ncbi:MAG: DHA2 family efflux MFS transporter permease subunit [Sphingobacteriales bacterium]|nr:MAG: DHA2 family efflux MFS transporter permease subunit [Sphingobacteriales bacterium]
MATTATLEQNSLVEYGFRRIIITITVVVCTLLEILDTTIVNVATNNLMGSLGATVSEVSWVVAAYAIANIIVVPMSGWLSAQFGRKYYFAGSVALFTFASFMCGESSTIWTLVFWRFVQGGGGGALFATSQTILKEIYPPEKMGMAMAMFGLGVIVGPTIGPVLGGYLVDNFDWPVIFHVNVPIGIIAIILTLRYIKDNPYQEKQEGSIDYIGIILLIIGVGSLQLVLEQGEREEWFESAYIIKFTMVAIVGIIGFLIRELFIKNPIVDLTVMIRGNVAIGSFLNFLLGFILFGTVFVFPIYFQGYLGFTAMQSGLMFTPGAIASALCMPFIGIMLTKGVPPKFLIMAGFAINAGFVFWSSELLTTSTPEEAFFWPLLIRGIGTGLLFVPLSNLTLGGLFGQDIGQASGLSNMIRQLGGSMSVALIGAMTERFSAQHRADIMLHITPDNPLLIQRLNGYGALLSTASSDMSKVVTQSYAALNMAVQREAMILSYIDIFRYFVILIIISLPLVMLAKNYKVDPAAQGGGH